MKACEAEQAAYVDACPGSWRKYWDDRFRRGMPIRAIGK